MLLHNQEITEEIKEEIKKYLEKNELLSKRINECINVSQHLWEVHLNSFKTPK